MTALTIVFPCFNEAERLPRTFERYLAHFPADPEATELLVVDDGSTDDTLAVAERIASRDPRIRVLSSERNRGKGFAVRTGVSYGPDAVDQVVRALDRAPVAIGVRPVGLNERPEETASPEGPAPDARAGTRAGPALRRLASRVFNQAIRLALGLPFHDTQCGLKGFQRKAATELFSRSRLDGFAFDTEILFLTRRLGYQVVEVPVQVTQHDGSKVRLAVDALQMLRDVWSVRRAAARGAYDHDQTRLRNHAG